MPIKYCKSDIEDGLNNYMEWYLNNVEEALKPEIVKETDNEIHINYYEPTGVAAVISPWNYPISNFIWGVIPNLLVGNTVIFKHSEECALTEKMLEEIIKVNNLPEKVLNFVYGNGDIGEILINQDINLISFTGSTNVGKHIYEVAGKKFIKSLMELGGSAPAPGIVFKDIKPETILNVITYMRFSNSGQMCDELKRLIVHENICDEMIETLVDTTKKLKVGDPLDPATEIGPLVSEKQLQTAHAQLEDAIQKEAKVVTGGKKPEGLDSAFLEATILTNATKEMRVWKEEVFAPILPIVKFSTKEEAISLGNDTDYGLGGYVFTLDTAKSDRVARKLRTGMVSINGTNYASPYNIFGGIKSSGKGREHGIIGLRELCELKVVSSNK